jgi:hypothetical protein
MPRSKNISRKPSRRVHAVGKLLRNLKAKAVNSGVIV